jgi:hypothetical protein
VKIHHHENRRDAGLAVFVLFGRPSSCSRVIDSRAVRRQDAAVTWNIRRQFRSRPAVALAVSALALTLLSACGGSLFKVKPISALPPMPSSAASANVGAITFRAVPVLTDEESQELFESNLQLAGLLSVRVQLVHNGGDSLDLRKVRFRLRDSSGTEWKAISTKKAVSRILKANGIFLYNPHSRRTFEDEFRAYALDLKTPFAQAEGRRQGFLVFVSPHQEPVASPRGLALTVEGLSQTTTLNLN